jgi:S-adenosylmethionine:tRNA ribosyltransferase-isomerase
MRPASAPRVPERLLLVDPARDAFADARPEELASLLSPGDLLVMNDAATLPGSLAGKTPRGQPVEVRLLSGAVDALSVFHAVLLGAGDWRTRTEHRPAPEKLAPGDEIAFGPDLRATVVSVSELSPRLVTLRFDRSGAELYRALYAHGRAIQYAHVPQPLDLWSVQTGYASRPWAVEMPSAGRPLSFEVLLGLKRRGVALATLTHAAGVSATGDPAIDAALPLPERYEIPQATVDAVARARRVVAVGTSVVRSLEGAFARCGELRAGPGETDLVIRAGFEPRVVDALLTGMHEREASHFDLLQAFAPRALIEHAYEHAVVAGYRGHEFGDATLILARVTASAA